MLTFEQQERILTPLLKKENNKFCADCDTMSPTWASLDFGVFVCSNCAGAHRVLGPTITRIKSIKLDQWKVQWLDNMQLGNEQINSFWENSKESTLRKPKNGSTAEQYSRFVYDKYIKRKYVTEKTATDPLTCYKRGIPILSTISQKQESNASIIPSKTTPVNVNDEKTEKVRQVDLLDDFFFEEKNKIRQQNYSTKSEDGDDEFDDFVEATVPVQKQEIRNDQPKKMNFDDLFKNHNHPQSPPQPLNHGQYNPNPYGQVQQQNHHFGFVPQQGLQYAHNPYVGSFPHSQSQYKNFTLN